MVGRAPWNVCGHRRCPDAAPGFPEPGTHLQACNDRLHCLGILRADQWSRLKPPAQHNTARCRLLPRPRDQTLESAC
jgi:hypothetical protein